MVSSDTQVTAKGPITAKGPTNVGFRTQGADIGVGAEISGDKDGVRGSCGDGSGNQGAGVVGTGTQNDGNGVLGIADVGSKAVGVFGISSSGFAGWFDGQVRIKGDLHVKGDLTVTGDKAAVVPFPDGSQRCLYAMESPESWFEDFGFGELVDGYAEIQLESGFASVVNGDTYHVFISEYEENSALYVTARTGAGFKVRAKNPTASGQFSYRVVAKRKDKASQRFREMAIEPEKDLRREAAAQGL
jgi:hypothetical protein